MLKVELIGNLGADIEIKDANGSKFVTMRIANTDKYKGEDGVEKSVTTWVDVTFNNVESKIIPFLKAGTKVFVRGNAKLRVYSSAKDRCMKAGLTVVASEIELCGGNTGELFSPDNGAMFQVAKYYQTAVDTKSWKKEDQCLLVDKQARRYIVVKGGWVAPERVPDNNDSNTNS